MPTSFCYTFWGDFPAKIVCLPPVPGLLLLVLLLVVQGCYNLINRNLRSVSFRLGNSCDRHSHEASSQACFSYLCTLQVFYVLDDAGLSALLDTTAKGNLYYFRDVPTAFHDCETLTLRGLWNFVEFKRTVWKLFIHSCGWINTSIIPYITRVVNQYLGIPRTQANRARNRKSA
jgi:hypothetical protein